MVCWSQWLRGLRRRSVATRLLRSLVRIPPGAWMFVCCECCVLSGRGLCDELITRPEESYRLWCVVVGDLEISRMRRPWPALGRSATEGKKINMVCSWHTIVNTLYNGDNRWRSWWWWCTSRMRSYNPREKVLLHQLGSWSVFSNDTINCYDVVASAMDEWMNEWVRSSGGMTMTRETKEI